MAGNICLIHQSAAGPHCSYIFLEPRSETKGRHVFIYNGDLSTVLARYADWTGEEK